MDRVDGRYLVLGFVVGVVLLAALLWLVDVDQVVAALTRADPIGVGLTVGLALCWLLAWGLTLKTVLAAVDVGVSVGSSFLVYTAAVFANNVTPFGWAGGEAVTALIISNVTDTKYDTGLVSIATVDVLNAISALALVLIGAGAYASSFPFVVDLFPTVGPIAAFVVAIVVAVAIVWRFREPVIDRVAGPVATTVEKAGGGLSGSNGVSEHGVKDILWRFVGNVEVIASSRRRLALALSLSAIGWAIQAIALVTAFGALGRSLPVVVALFVIPLANLAGMTPLPGGLGGIEAAFVALLVPATGIEAAVVTASVLLFRAVIYWMPIFLGGTYAAVYGFKVLS